MNYSRPALAFIILAASLALLSAREPAHHVYYDLGRRPAPHGGVFGFRRIGRSHDEAVTGLGWRQTISPLNCKELEFSPEAINGTFFQEFEFSAGVRVLPEENSLLLQKKEGDSTALVLDKDFRPLAFTGNGSVSGEVVFAGYGLRVPGKEGKEYNSYAGLDVRDKIVLVLRYVPEDVSPERRADLNRYAGLRYKALTAREQGAKALLVVTGPNSPGAGELVSIASDAGMMDSAIPAASISLDTAEALFGAPGKTSKSSNLDWIAKIPMRRAVSSFPV